MDDTEPPLFPSENQYNSHLLSDADKRLPADQIVKKLLDMRYVEITDGLPADSSNKLYEIMTSYLDIDLTGDFDLPFDPVSRFPILAYKSNGSKVRTFLLTYPGRIGKMNHVTLARRLKEDYGFDEQDLVYTTSFGGISNSYNPSSGSYLLCALTEEEKPAYIKLQHGSDHYASHPFSQKGKEIFAKIAQNTPGVTFIA